LHHELKEREAFAGGGTVCWLVKGVTLGEEKKREEGNHILKRRKRNRWITERAIVPGRDELRSERGVNAKVERKEEAALASEVAQKKMRGGGTPA